MDEYKEDIGYLFILLGVVGFIILFFLISYYDLVKFKKCYDNNFNLNYCEKYKSY